MKGLGVTVKVLLSHSSDPGLTSFLTRSNYVSFQGPVTRARLNGIYDFIETFKGVVIRFWQHSSCPTPLMLPFRLDKSNLSPLKKGASPRLDCRDLFFAKHHMEPLSPTESALAQRNQLFEGAQKSTQDIMHHGAPLPLVWVGPSHKIVQRVHVNSFLMMSCRCLYWTTSFQIMLYHFQKHMAGLSSSHERF